MRVRLSYFLNEMVNITYDRPLGSIRCKANTIEGSTLMVVQSYLMAGVINEK